MIKKICSEIWKISLNTNTYFLDFEKKIVIDPGKRSDKQELTNFLSKLIDFKEVNIVIFTHLHYDHVGNLDLFPNAKFYASKESITDFKNNSYGSVLGNQEVELLKKIEIHPLTNRIENLIIIETPGHTKGDVCLYYEKELVLFSGDTIFDRGLKGRIDLPTSIPIEQPKSIIKLLNYPFKILCPGHDY